MWRVLHCLQKTGQVGQWSIALLCNTVMLSDETVGCGNSNVDLSNISQVQGMPKPLGRSATREINPAHWRPVFYKANIMFHNNMKHFHHTRQSNKKVPAFYLNYIESRAKVIYWSLLKSGSRKTFPKMSCYKTLWWIDGCTPNNSQVFSEMDRV